MHSLMIPTLYLLVITVPLAFTTFNYELFEFPKLTLLLIASAVLFPLSLLRLSWPKELLSQALLVFLFSQILATVFSINPHTSFWGYYSRFHQGLLTTLCYTLIYFAARASLSYKTTQKLIKLMIYTAIIISVYAILQHFGIDQSLWIQDVVTRPFSTLGQPNWLAAYLLPPLFLTLYLALLSSRLTALSLIAYPLLFTALLLSRSRSGFLAFILAYLTYSLLTIRNLTWQASRRPLLLFFGITLALALFLGTPLTPSLPSLLTPAAPTPAPAATGTQLETGGTESGDIRRIVWQGALNLIQKRPLLGTGPETFAYSYYWTRPLAHNYTSEWDFLYNKAHNEYLNIGATTGLLGLGAYLFWHVALARLGFTLRRPSKSPRREELALAAYLPALAAALVAFTVTNFFGFSVIPVTLSLILLSALPSSLSQKSPPPAPPLTPPLILTSLFLVLLFPLRLFLADLSFTRGKRLLESGHPAQAVPALVQARNLRPGEPLFRSYLAEAYATSTPTDSSLTTLALAESAQALTLNPWHLNYLKSATKVHLALAASNPQEYQAARTLLERARTLAPTDPKLAYNLGLVYSRLGDSPASIGAMQEALTLKQDYYEPYYALTLLYEETKQLELIPPLLQKAHEHLPVIPPALQTKLDKYL